MKTFAFFFASVTVAFMPALLRADSGVRCVAVYPNPISDPTRKEVEPRMIALLDRLDVTYEAGGSATVWISVAPDVYERVRAALLQAVRDGEFEPSVVYAEEAWTTSPEGVRRYDFAKAEAIVRKQAAEPGATDNPDGAQRFREDH